MPRGEQTRHSSRSVEVNAVGDAGCVSADRPDELPTTPLSHRSDARRNRVRIVQAAHKVLARSQNASLRSIAREAGVGQGTLYRHFPDRQSLIAEVYKADLAELAERAEALLRMHAPLSALRLWFGRVAAVSAEKPCLTAVLWEVPRGAKEDAHSKLIAVISRMLRAGKDADEIRRDVNAEEVMFLLSTVCRSISGTTYMASPAHQIDLIVGGIQQPLSTEPERVPYRPMTGVSHSGDNA